MNRAEVVALAKAVGGSGGGGGGGGGSVLIVNVTVDEGIRVLDKTWKEIKDAYVGGVFIVVYDNKLTNPAIESFDDIISIFSEVDGEDIYYSVLFGQGTLFEAMSEDEYPVYVNDL